MYTFGEFFQRILWCPSSDLYDTNDLEITQRDNVLRLGRRAASTHVSKIFEQVYMYNPVVLNENCRLSRRPLNENWSRKLMRCGFAR